MAIIKGTVEFFANPDKFGKVSLRVSGDPTYYNTKPEWFRAGEVKKGDQVEFDNGGGKYIKNLKVTGSGGSTPASNPSSSKGSTGGRQFPVPIDAPERTINRQNALTNAVNMLKETGIKPISDAESTDYALNVVVPVARIFEAYTTGQLDEIEARTAQDDLLEGMGA